MADDVRLSGRTAGLVAAWSIRVPHGAAQAVAHGAGIVSAGQPSQVTYGDKMVAGTRSTVLV
jgi:hypothetical protein